MIYRSSNRSEAADGAIAARQLTGPRRIEATHRSIPNACCACASVLCASVLVDASVCQVDR